MPSRNRAWSSARTTRIGTSSFLRVASADLCDETRHVGIREPARRLATRAGDVVRRRKRDRPTGRWDLAVRCHERPRVRTAHDEPARVVTVALELLDDFVLQVRE